MTKRKVSIAELLRQSFEGEEVSLASFIERHEKDREYLFAKTPQVRTFRVVLHSSRAAEGEKSVDIKETMSLKKVLQMAVGKFKEINKRSDVQAFWHVSVILPSGREVHIPVEHWAHLKELPLAKNVFHHDDPPCKERLVKKGGGDYCPSCKLRPGTQSKSIWRYCPTCDIPLKDLQCPKCHLEYA